MSAEETMDAQNFNFDPKFPPNKSFSASNFAFFDEKFLTKRRFSDSPKFRGKWVPPATKLLIALKYEAAPLPFVVSGAPGGLLTAVLSFIGAVAAIVLAVARPHGGNAAVVGRSAAELRRRRTVGDARPAVLGQVEEIRTRAGRLVESGRQQTQVRAAAVVCSTRTDD